jgi:hypothetical protein
VNDGIAVEIIDGGHEAILKLLTFEGRRENLSQANKLSRGVGR